MKKLLFIVCVLFCKTAWSQDIPKYTFKDIAYEAYNLNGILSEDGRKTIVLFYNQDEIFIINCTSPYIDPPQKYFFCATMIKKNSDVAISWILNREGLLLSYKETNNGNPILLGKSKSEIAQYIQGLRSRCADAILIQAGLVMKRTQGGFGLSRHILKNVSFFIL